MTAPKSTARRSLVVGIVAPSGFVPDTGVIDRAAARFSERGWRVIAGDTCFERHLRFAGDDDLRGAELQGFCTDRSLDVVLMARGGYGLTRLLDRIDFDSIRKAGRVICGYSDFTAFNLAYLARAQGVSLHGPSAIDFGAVSPHEATFDEFFSVVERRAHHVAFDVSGPACEARGVLWGGNLALVCALLGTKYFPRVRNGVLFLEDVNEPAYKIERMLIQLMHAGVLQRQRAIMLGAFDPITPMPNDDGYTLASAIDMIRSQVKTPILTGLPFGHVPHKLTLPVGAAVELVVRQGRASLSWKRWR